ARRRAKWSNVDPRRESGHAPTRVRAREGPGFDATRTWVRLVAGGRPTARGTVMALSVKPAIQPQFRTIDGLDVRIAESEPRNEHALLLSPWPESLFAYDAMWPRLAEHAHLVAVDLPGFGHSEGRASLFAPRAMGAFVTRVADEFGLEHPHVVGPDV